MRLSTASIRNEELWKRNERKATAHERCIICGREVKPGSGIGVWLHGGGSYIIDSEAEAELLGGSSADLGGYPIGPECYRKHRKILDPFVLFDYSKIS